MKHVLIIALIVILFVSLITNQQIYAEDKIKIIESCEKLYQEYLEVGQITFSKRYQYSLEFKNCHVLFKNPAWSTNDSDRIKILSELISFLNGEQATRNVRDRPEIKDFVTPQWIKTDAKMWYEGKQTDSRFAYGIRYLIEAKMVIPPTIVETSKIDCTQEICLREGDYIKYSITGNKLADTITIKDTFGKIKNNSIEVNSIKISRDGKDEINFLVDRNTGITNLVDEKRHCCKKYTLVHSVPIEIGQKINSNEPVQVLENTILDYQGLKRDVLIARNTTNDYMAVIDEKTGVVFLSEYKQPDYWKKTEVIDSNLFLDKKGIQYNQLEIPNGSKTLQSGGQKEQYQIKNIFSH